NRIRTHEGRFIRMRMAILCGVLAMGLGVVVASGFRLMVIDGSAWHDLALTQRERRLHVAPKRGTITDRNGSALAVSIDVPSVSMDAYELMRGVSPHEQPAVARAAATAISQALSLDVASVERKILRKRRFNWLKRRITREEAEAVRRLGSSDNPGGRIR